MNHRVTAATGVHTATTSAQDGALASSTVDPPPRGAARSGYVAPDRSPRRGPDAVTTPFLLQFSDRLVHALVARETLALAPGRAQQEVVEALATALAAAENKGLVRVIATTLLGCDAVDDLFADDAEIAETIESLGPSALR
jgi:hypothetical protein